MQTLSLPCEKKIARFYREVCSLIALKQGNSDTYSILRLIWKKQTEEVFVGVRHVQLSQSKRHYAPLSKLYNKHYLSQRYELCYGRLV